MDERVFFDPAADPERFVSAIVESSEDAIIGKAIDGTIVTWNRGAELLYGYTAREVRGRSIGLLFPDDRQAELASILQRIRRGERVDYYETVRRTKDGRLVTVWLTVAPVLNAEGRAVGAATLGRNITGQKHAQIALKTSEQRWEAMFKAAVDGIVVIDTRGLIEAFNPAAECLFGYTQGEVIGRNVALLMPSPFREEHDAYLARYIRTGEARIIGRGRDVRGVRKDGTTFPLHLSVGEMAGGERKFVGILHDLSDRVALEERIRAGEAQWRSIVESAVDGIVVIDAFGQIDAFNPAAERLFGFTEAEVLGKNVTLLMPSPYREEHDMYVSRYLTTGEARIIGKGREVTARRKDGTTFPIHLAVGEMSPGGERKFTGIIHDLTPRVRIESQLREQAAMVHLGEMAALVAHEVKNPLAGIRGAIQVIGTRLPAGSRDAAITQEIVARIDGLNGLMKDLLLYARPPQPHLRKVDLRDVVATTATLLHEDPESAGVKVEISGACQEVTADPDLLRIVFANLLVNAAQAMGGSGVVRVSLTQGDRACRVAFADDGPGIPAEVRARIFTPFFTTKSRGSGLGLPTAKRLVDAQGGEIEVACPAAGGTTVTIQLPA